MGLRHWYRQANFYTGTQATPAWNATSLLFKAQEIDLAGTSHARIARVISDIRISMSVPIQSAQPSNQWWAFTNHGYSVYSASAAGGPPNQVFNTPDPEAVLTGYLQLQGGPYTDPTGTVTAVWTNGLSINSEAQRKTPVGLTEPIVCTSLSIVDPAALTFPLLGHLYDYSIQVFTRVLYIDP